jgi:hypothetical protein
VLVARSYGGYPVTGAADGAAGRIGQLIYLDASIGRNGTAMCGTLPPEVVAQKLALATELRGGQVLGGLGVERYGLTDPADAAWVARRVTPQPAGTYTEPLRLEHPAGNGKPCSYIRCTRPRLPSLEESYRQARELGMTCYELQAGHDAMVSAPAELSDLLLRIVPGVPRPRPAGRRRAERRRRVRADDQPAGLAGPLPAPASPGRHQASCSVSAALAAPASPVTSSSCRTSST